MVSKFHHILVLCVDRDDDLGRKANVKGPIIGKDANLKAAVKLALQDPEDSDVNAVFAAIKKFEETKKNFKYAEIATLTGHGKLGIESDKKIHSQLDKVLEKFPANGVILVTDGAEDDQIIPLLQGRATIVSKETVVIKQARNVESFFYLAKEALTDPFIAKVVLGIPGIALLIYVTLPTIGLQVIMFIAGIYLLLKGFGIERRLLKTLNTVTTSIQAQRTSFPFYLASIFIFGFGLLSSYLTYRTLLQSDLWTQAIEVFTQILFFSIVSILSFNIGRGIDSIHMKKAYLLKRYFRAIVSTALIWFIFDAGKQVFIGRTNLNLFLITIVASFVVIFISYKASNLLEVRRKVNRLLIGFPIYSQDGEWVGKVEKVNEDKKQIYFKEKKSKKFKTISKDNIEFQDGRIFLTTQL